MKLIISWIRFLGDLFEGDDTRDLNRAILGMLMSIAVGTLLFTGCLFICVEVQPLLFIPFVGFVFYVLGGAAFYVATGHVPAHWEPDSDPSEQDQHQDH